MRQLSSAAAQAKARHVSVDIPSLTTETTKVTANPNGTYTMTDNPLPVRVKSHGRWRPISAVLRRGPGRNWTTTATPSRLSLSGGGTGPMAVLTSPVGGRLALTFPGRLPAPAVRGATATYRNVQPGITLRLTATSLGGLTETLIAANSKAAASPRFRQLRLALATSGLHLRRTRAGTMEATGPHGVAEFSSFPAAAWNTQPRTGIRPAVARNAPARQPTAQAPALARTSVSAQALTIAAPTGVVSASASYPAYVSAGITPDSVSGCGNQATCYDEKNGPAGYTEVKAGCDTYAGWNNNDQYGNGVGNQDYGGGCGGVYRAYYQIDTRGLVALKSFGTVHVEAAKFSADENYGSDHNCSDRWPVTLHLTDVIDSNTDWKNKPANNGGDQPRTQSPTPGPNPGSTCTKQLVQFTVAYAMDFAVNNDWNITTFGLQGDETASADPDPAAGAPTNACAGGDSTGGLSAAGYNCGFMRIGDNPNVTTTFDITPPTPFCNNTNSTTQDGSAGSCDTQLIPIPHDSPGVTDFGCGPTATGWINQTSVKFNVAAQAAITGEDVSVSDNVWDNSDSINSTIAQVTSAYYPTSGSANITAGTATALSGLQDGHQYGWDAAANVDGSEPNTNNGSDGSNGPYSSGRSGHCRFNIDTSAPANLSVQSTQFPSSSSGRSGQDAGTTGMFTFSADDPVPTGCATTCQASGVYEFTYSLNGGPEASVKPAAATSAGATQTYSVQLPIGNWGTNVLSVTATDNADNVTNTFFYTFYAPWNPGTVVTNGDVNGDGIPDLLGTTSTNLILYPGDTNPAASVQSGSGCGSPTAVYNGPCIAAPESGSPNGTAWNGFLIAHRGTMSNEGVDDLFAYNKTNNQMYVINNNPSNIGAAPQLSASNTSSTHTIPDHPVCAPTDNASNCTGYPGGTANPNTSNWAGVQQIIAPGDAWSGAASDTGLASLITVENGTLWLYQGAFGGALSGATFTGATGPIQLGSSAGTTNWSSMTLIAPGDVNGKLTLWALDKATGAIYSYPITIDPTSNQPTINPAGTGTPVTATSGPIVATIPTSNNYVAFASPGPLDNSSFPGLYAESTTGTSPSGSSCANGCLWFYPGQSTAGGASPLSTTRMYVGTLNTPVSQLS